MIIVLSGIVASSLLDVGQQVGGSIGLAILGTVARSAVASNLRSHTASAATAAGHPLTAATQKQITDHALATGFSQAFLVCAAIGLLGAPADQACSAREE